MKNAIPILLLVSFMASGQHVPIGTTGIQYQPYEQKEYESIRKIEYAKIVTSLYSDYKKECWADSTENKTQLYTSCTHKECIEKTVSDYRKKLEETKPEISNNLGITVLNKGYISSFYPSHKCTKKGYSHREPTFEGFMTFIAKLK